MLQTTQTTLKKAVMLEGKSLHSGVMTKLKMIPCSANTGIVFKRIDLAKNNIVEAKYNNIKSTNLCTEIANEHKVTVSTIEHLMAALFALKIDNLLIEVNGSELPILDGSSAKFVSKILEAGVDYLNVTRKVVKIIKTVEVFHNGSKLVAKPREIGLALNVEVDFDHAFIGKQSFEYTDGTENFIDKLSQCRTFGFLKDVEYLRSKGLAKGASLSNAVVIGDKSLAKGCTLRYKDELVRHKALDMLGDLYLAGFRVQAKIEAYKPGHTINNMLLHKVFSDQSNYDIIDQGYGVNLGYVTKSTSTAFHAG